jgi:histone H3/H4
MESFFMAEEEFNEEEILEEEEVDDLPFAKAEVVRLMKQNLDDDKMIRERVKVEMNKFLGDILKQVCEQLNEYPYTTIEYEMLKESTYPYTNIKRINQEKERILLHLNAIKADCDALAMDVQKTLKLKDVVEEDEFTPLSMTKQEEDEEEIEE